MTELTLPSGIPESIPFARVQELFAALGLPLDELAGFRVYSEAIVAEYYALDDKGLRWCLDGNVVAINRVVIRVDRADDPASRFARRPNVHDDGAVVDGSTS